MIIVWKDEGTYGPISTYNTREEIFRGRPYDPNRKPPEWITRSEALRRAKELGAEFIEV